MVELFFLRMPLSARELARFAHDVRIDGRDTGYLVHLLLRRTFAADAPQPFHLEERDRELLLYGYGAVGETALLERLDFADPLAAAVFDAVRLASRPMPTRFSPGRLLGFRLRSCPIVRQWTEEDGRRRIREMDAFLHAAHHRAPEEPLARERVYRDWLTERLERSGARLREARLLRMSQVPLVRRRHHGTTDAAPRLLERREGTKAIRARRPDVTFDGILEVVDPDAFAAAIVRGIGRHRAFGYGMLLLRPAG